jgi:hypothetical protein
MSEYKKNAAMQMAMFQLQSGRNLKIRGYHD